VLVTLFVVVAVDGAGCQDGLTSVGTGNLGAPDGSAAGTGNLMGVCCTDSDCGNPYLACTATSVSICGESGPAPDAGASTPPACGLPDHVPTCPTTEQVTLGLCIQRYQRACHVDSDCGPAGFTCNSGSCAELPTTHPCASEDECPQGWSCYSPCPCNGVDVYAKGCYPPFAEFNCPVCVNGTIADAGVSQPTDR
jgi:hypothetical protein